MSHEVRNSALGGGLAMIVLTPGLITLDRLELQDVTLPVEEVLCGSASLAALVAVSGIAACFKGKRRS
jgi:hypothetical protein